ncbi:MAG: hypothetical protein M1836_005091 [Candelina mexicana]|nr:MAG: hypothetical protein M1836_005091 [Candelina mexicana]
MAWAPLVNGRLQLQLAAVTPPLVPEAHCGSVANEPALEARSTIAATEFFSSSSSEDRSAIVAFSDFEVSLSEAYTKFNTLPALVQGGEISPRAPDAPEQDTSSEEGLLDEKNYTGDEHGISCRGVLSDSSSAVCSIDIKKPSTIEAAKALAMPDTMMGEHGISYESMLSNSSSAVCSIDIEKPSTIEAAEALALPGHIYKHDRCVDHCV